MRSSTINHLLSVRKTVGNPDSSNPAIPEENRKPHKKSTETVGDNRDDDLRCVIAAWRRLSVEKRAMIISIISGLK